MLSVLLEKEPLMMKLTVKEVSVCLVAPSMKCVEGTFVVIKDITSHAWKVA